MEVTWNPWHGCRKISEGCRHCYVYRADSKYDKDSSVVRKTAAFSLPLAKDRRGLYKYPSGTLFFTCFTSDFFIEEADGWRSEAWRIMKERSDCGFVFFTKRICRAEKCLPPDWGGGYPNVTVGCTVENRAAAESRMPPFRAMPAAKKIVVCAPLLEEVYLGDISGVDEVSAGGESGENARPCDFSWVLNLREQALDAGAAFTFHQTGARLVKDGVLYKIPRAFQHSQAKKAGIDILADKKAPSRRR